MAQLVALLQSDASLLRCQLRRLDTAIDLGAVPGKAVGVGYYENGKVLVRKRPASPQTTSLERLASDVRSEFLMAACHGVSPHGFREEDTEPYRFRNWVFAGTGRIVPLGERASILASLPAVLRRGVVGPSDAELAFMVALAHVYSESRTPEHPDLPPEIAADALKHALSRLDEQALTAGAPRPQTCALLSNGRMIVAVRRGRPLSYGLIEGFNECTVCGIDRTTNPSDPRVKPHRLVKAVALASRPKKNGVQWVEIPENHLVTVSRDFAVRVVPL